MSGTGSTGRLAPARPLVFAASVPSWRMHVGLPASRSSRGGAPHLPLFNVMNRAYSRDPNAQSFKRTVGGHVDDTAGQEWLTDTRTLRLGRALNYAGSPIPRNAPGLRTVTGRDRLRYAFAVREFKTWVLHRFGPPDVKVAGPPVSRDKFAGHHGLIISTSDLAITPDRTGAQRAMPICGMDRPSMTSCGA